MPEYNRTPSSGQPAGMSASAVVNLISNIALNDLTNVDTDESKMGDGDVLMYNSVENIWGSGIIPVNIETVNTLTGLNFNNVATNNLIKKVDANNAGNSNILSSYMTTGSVTTLISGDPNGIITSIGGQIITSTIGAEAKLEITTGVGGARRSIILQENQPVIIEDDLNVVNLEVGGLIKLDGALGNAGDVLTSNGASLPTWNPSSTPTPYYIEIDIGNNGSASIYSIPTNTFNTINTLTTLTTPVSAYDSDLIDSSTWSPSITGVFFINFNANIRCINQDYLVEAQITVDKLVGGVYVKQLLTSNRNDGSCYNEADARVWNMNLNCPYTFYATAGDKYKFTFYGRSYNNNAIWLMAVKYSSNIRITKLA